MSDPRASSRDNLQLVARRAMVDRGFLPDFDATVRAELAAISGPATTQISSIRDLRGLLWASIDNDDSLDLDQLSVAEPLAGDQVKVLVAIADVDTLVRKASAIDAHAQHNTTSVYTAAQVFPMLPERLSTDLTSLGEGQERLAVVIEMMVDSGGTVVGSDVYRAMVLNRSKLAYSSVTAWLTGQGPMPPRVAAVPGLAERLRLQDRVGRALRTRRSHPGAPARQAIEPRAAFDRRVLADLLARRNGPAEAGYAGSV